MKKWGKRQFGSRILAGMIVLAVCGCAGRIPQEKRAAIGSDYMEIYGGNTITRTGYFTNASGILYYVDFTTQDAIPVCNKPTAGIFQKRKMLIQNVMQRLTGQECFHIRGSCSESVKIQKEMKKSTVLI